MSYDSATITRDEIQAFADRFSEGELITIRNTAQDAMIADSGDVIITSLGTSGTNGTGQLTGKPRYLMSLATAALRWQTDSGTAPISSTFNFGTRRMET